jgi:glucokinase
MARRDLGTCVIAAVDIGGTKIAVGMVDDDGRVLARQEIPTNAELGYAHAFDRIVGLLRQVAQTVGSEITGIGIGCTGPVDPFSGEIGDVNFLPGWQGTKIVEDLKRLFRVTVAMENDADAAALGEAAWGAGKDKTRLIYVTVGTGIGGGIILDGKLYRGVDQAHPEIGHHVIDASGPACTCGFHGCWESLASGPAMAEWMKLEAASDPHRVNLSAKTVCELAVAGDALARRAVDREGYYLGLGLANLVVLYTPDAIVLGGSVMRSANLFLGSIRKVIRESCRYVPFEKTTLALASLGEEANLIGAARTWHHRFASGGPA